MPIPEQKLDPVTPTASKRKHRTTRRLLPQDILCQRRQPCDPLAHTIRSTAGEDSTLVMFDHNNRMTTTPLADELEAQIAKMRPKLLVSDTLADLHNGDENSRIHARKIVGYFRGLAIRHKMAVVVLSHPSLTGMANGSGISGSTAWNGSVRSRLYLSRIISEAYEADPNARRLSVKKSNYGPIGTEIDIRWQNGVFVPKLGNMPSEERNTKAERVFLFLVDSWNEDGRPVGPSPGPNYAPKLFGDDPRSEGVTKRAFASVMTTLLAAGKIKISETGPKSKIRKIIIRGTPNENIELPSAFQPENSPSNGFPAPFQHPSSTALAHFQHPYFHPP